MIIEVWKTIFITVLKVKIIRNFQSEIYINTIENKTKKRLSGKTTHF